MARSLGHVEKWCQQELKAAKSRNQTTMKVAAGQAGVCVCATSVFKCLYVRVCRTKPLPFNVAAFGHSVLKLFTMLTRLANSKFGLCFASLT